MNSRVDTNPTTRKAVCDLLCDELEKGYSIQHACDVVSVSHSLYYGWRDAARRGDDEAILLLRRLKRARAIGRDKLVGPIRAAAESGEDWRAAAWLIDRQYPDMRLDATHEEIEVPEPPQDDQLAGYGAPERLAEMARMAREIGLHKVDLDAKTQPAKPQPATPADPIRQIAQVARVALSGGERDHKELTDTIIDTLHCTAQQVFEAYDRLGVEVLPSAGRKTRLRLPRRTHENEAGRTNEPARSEGLPAVRDSARGR